MTRRAAGWVVSALLLALGNVASAWAAPLPPLFRVNVPYFADRVHYEQTGIFWFGRVNSTENYADARVGYDDRELYVNVSIFDRWLRYDPAPAPDDLTNWDAVSLYLDMNGNTGQLPDLSTFRLDGQLTWWEDRGTSWQAAYCGNGSGWLSVTVPFTTTVDWWGNAPNHDDEDDRGWAIWFHIPFKSLGLSGPPPQGTLWGLGVAVHDRDDAAGTPIADKVWPEGMFSDRPATWGQLVFGLSAYAPQAAAPMGTVTIRHNLNGAVVPDAAVGGTVGNMCPGDSDYIWNQWADFQDPHGMQVNIHGLGIIYDWPCVSRYYITFPLNAVPTGKVIISATLTLHQFGSAGVGWTPPPQPSWIQVLTVEQDWDENTLTWNNAPRARENISGSWVPVLPDYAGDPGIPRTWDVSRAVAEAYRAGEPLRLTMYPSDWELNGGKYFWSSDHDENPAEARPTLTVVWGDPAATVRKTVWPLTPSSSQQVTYTLSLLGSGHELTLIDDLPAEVSSPGPIGLVGGGGVTYDWATHRLTWTGAPTVGQPVTLTFPITLVASGPQAVRNTAALADSTGNMSTDTATLIVDARQVWLPLMLHE